MHVFASAKNAAAINTGSGDVTATYGAIFVSTGGDVKVDTINGDTVTFVSVANSFILPVAVTKIYQTGTTATGMIGLNW